LWLATQYEVQSVTHGPLRVHALTNIVYNMRRFLFLERLKASA
jgi:hypothetical protein